MTARGKDVLAAARAAIDLDRFSGFADFTSGVVSIEQEDDERIVLSTDSRWAATAVRAALRRAGCAVEGDRANETTTVTVWATGESDAKDQPELKLSDERDPHGRTVFFLEGPEGMVEQQCGSGGFNDLIVHARHPFPGAARGWCSRHGDGCWRRADWPLEARTRHLFKAIMTEDGSAWQAASKAADCMRSLYALHVHRTIPGASLPAARAFIPALRPHVPAPRTEKLPNRQSPARTHHWVVDVIPDLAGFGAVPEEMQVT